MRMQCLAVCFGFLALGAEPPPPPSDEFFESAGVRIHYQVRGTGTPVLLIHGFAADIQTQWVIPGLSRALAKKYQVIAFDARGHGRSDKPHDPAKYGLEMVEDCVRLLDHLHIARAHVVGYSMGAIIAGRMLQAHPDRFLTVIFGGAAPIRAADDIRFFDRLADDLDQGRGIGSLIVMLTPPDRRPPTDDQLRMVNRMNTAFNDPKALAACVRGWKQLVVSEQTLQMNRVPALALVGVADPLRKYVDALGDKMADLEVDVVPHSDHMDAFTRPDFARLLLDFLRRHAAACPQPKAVAK